MSDFSGRRISVGIGKETTRGTAAGAAYWLQHLLIDFLPKSTKIYNISGLGVLDESNAAEIVKDWAEGKIEGKVTDKAFGLLLLSLFGTDTPTLHAGETAVYDHVYTETNTNTNQSLTITRKDPNEDYQYALGMLKQLEITVVVGDFVKYVAEFVSKKGSTSTDTAAYVSENEFKPKYATLKMAPLVAGLGAATAIPVKSFKITIEKATDPYFVVGQNDPADIFNTKFNVKGDFVLRYSDTTYRTAMFSNTYNAIQLDIKNTDVTVGTATNPELIFTLPRTVLSEWKIDQKLDSMVEQTVGYQGLFDQVTAKQLTATLTNTVTSY